MELTQSEPGVRTRIAAFEEDADPLFGHSGNMRERKYCFRDASSTMYSGGSRWEPKQN